MVRLPTLPARATRGGLFQTLRRSLKPEEGYFWLYFRREIVLKFEGEELFIAVEPTYPMICGSGESEADAMEALQVAKSLAQEAADNAD